MKTGAAAAILLTAAGIALLLWSGGEKKDVSDSVEKTVPLRKKFTMEAGEERLYTVDSSSEITINLPAQTVHLSAKLRGILNARFFRDSRSQPVALMQFSPLSVRSGNPEMSRALTVRYSDPFVVLFRPDGHIEAVHFKGNDEEHQGIAELLGTLQTVLEGRQEYTTVEKLPDGNATVRYRHKNRTLLQKERLTFESPDSVEKQFVESRFLCRISPVWIERIDGNETVRFVKNGYEKIRSESRYRLRKTEQAPDRTLFIWRFRGSIDTLIDRYRNDEDEKYFERLAEEANKAYFKKKGITVASLLKDLDAEDLRRLNELVEYLKLHPEAARQLYEAVAKADDDLAAALINVLERAGTPRAQKILRDIAGSETFTHMNRLRAVVALGGVEKPTNESVDFLWRTYRQRETAEEKDLSNTALLNVAIAAPRSEKNDEIDQKLRDEYTERTDDPSRRRIILLSMQNAGAARFRDEIFEALDDKDITVKTAAVKALRRYDTTETRARLLQMFTTDQPVEVRRKVVRTLMTIGTDDALMQRARKNLFAESDSMVRRYLIRYLLQHKDAWPENIETLRRFKNVETDAENQRLLIKSGF